MSSWPRKIDPVPELRIEGPLAACSAYQSAPVIRGADTRASRWDGSQASTPPIELTVRGRAALRRREEPQPFVVWALAIDHGRPRATVDGAPVELTATEYELLRVLSLDAGRVVDFETLQRPVWPKRENAGANLVRIFVRNLGDSADSPAYIFNQRGVGYRMAAPGGSRQRPVASSGQSSATDDGD